MKLLVIDVQKALVVDDLYHRDAFLNNVVKLIKTARKHNIEVIHVQHDAGQGSGFSIGDEGFEIVEKAKPLEGERVFIKTINSAFGNKEFEQYLSQSDDKELMIVGLQTEFCVDATIKSAFERGYKVIIPNGTNSTFDNDYLDAKTTIKYYQKWIWQGVFANCVSLKEATTLLNNRNN